MQSTTDMAEQKDQVLKFIEQVPTQAYLGAALGSIALSALLRLTGAKDAAVFVGQWPPTFLLLALAAKLLRPSTESLRSNIRDTMQGAKEAIQETARTMSDQP